MPAVAYETLAVPEWKQCGFFKWEIKLFITNKSGPNPPPLQSSSERWIIQRLIFKRQITLCGEEESAPEIDEVYEAFRVGTDGKVKKKYSYSFKGDGIYTQIDLNAGSPAKLIPVDDLWLNSNNGGTFGNFIMDGEMYAIDSIEDGEFMVDPQQSGPAGQLPFSRKKPSGLGKPSLFRHVEGKWDCCGDLKTTSGKATAKNRWGTYVETWSSDGTHTKTVDGKKM